MFSIQSVRPITRLGRPNRPVRNRKSNSILTRLFCSQRQKSFVISPQNFVILFDGRLSMYRKKKSHWCHQTVLVRGPIDYQSNHFDFGLNTHRSKGEPHSTAVNSKSSFTKVNYDNRHNVVSVDEPTFFYTGSKVF